MIFIELDEDDFGEFIKLANKLDLVVINPLGAFCIGENMQEYRALQSAGPLFGISNNLVVRLSVSDKSKIPQEIQKRIVNSYAFYSEIITKFEAHEREIAKAEEESIAVDETKIPKTLRFRAKLREG